MNRNGDIKAALPRAKAEGIVVARIATLNTVDHDGDILRAGAIKDGTTAPVCVQHMCTRDPDKVGRATVHSEAETVMAFCSFNMESKQGRAAYAIASSPDAEWSWGYRVLDSRETTVNGRRVRELLALELLEVSIVLEAASIGTETLSAKTSAGADPELRFLREVGAVPVAECLLATDYVRAAKRYASEAARALGVPTPGVRFYRTMSGGEPADGWYSSSTPGVIWIKADLPPEALRATTLHESHHHAASLRGEPLSEALADRFAKILGQPKILKCYNCYGYHLGVSWWAAPGDLVLCWQDNGRGGIDQKTFLVIGRFDRPMLRQL